MRSKTRVSRTVAVLESVGAVAGAAAAWLAATAAETAAGAAGSGAETATARRSVTRRWGADCASAAAGDGSEARVGPVRSAVGVGVGDCRAAAERAALFADRRSVVVVLAAPAPTCGRAVRAWAARPSGLSDVPAAAAAAVSASLPLSATATAACGPAKDNPIANAAALTRAR